MTISQEDVQRLIDAQMDDPVLVLLEGRTMVLSAGDLDSEQYRGALRIASKADVVKSGSLSEQERRELAARLDTEVSQRGG